MLTLSFSNDMIISTERGNQMNKLSLLAVALDRLNEYGEIDITPFEFGNEYYELSKLLLSILNQSGIHYSFQTVDEDGNNSFIKIQLN